MPTFYVIYFSRKHIFARFISFYYPPIVFPIHVSKATALTSAAFHPDVKLFELLFLYRCHKRYILKWNGESFSTRA